MFLEIVEVAPLHNAQVMHTTVGLDVSKTAMFFKPTPLSADRALDASLHDRSGLPPGSLRDRLLAWAGQHNNGEHFASTDTIGRPSLGCFIPAFFGCMIMSRKLTTYSFPLPSNRNRFRALRLQLAQDLILGAPPYENHCPSLALVHDLNPQTLQSIGDNMRRLLSSGGGVGVPAALRDETLSWLGFIQGLRARQLHLSSDALRSRFDIAFLIDSVVIGGFLNDERNLHQVFSFALRALVRETATYGYLKELLDKDRHTPSAWTMQRSRLPVAVACAFLG